MESLKDFVSRIDRDHHLRVEADLGEGFVRLESSEAQRRQAAQDIRCSEDIVLELLRNSIDSGAQHIFIATGKENDHRLLLVIDDGKGIPANLHQAIFEARVTSKLESAHEDRWGFHGRGMALYSVAERSLSASVVASAPGLGTAITVETDTTTLTEKTDQSTFPRLQQEEATVIALRGPKNILRIAAEFSLEYKDRCAIYCGSQTEIAATIYSLGLQTTDVRQRVKTENVHQLPFWQRLSCASDPADFVTLALDIGLTLSERSARRIIDGTIPPLPSLLSSLKATLPTKESNATSQTPHKLSSATGNSGKRRSIPLEEEDRSEISRWVQTLGEDMGKRYYFTVADAPTITMNDTALTITLPIDPL